MASDYPKNFNFNDNITTNKSLTTITPDYLKELNIQNNPMAAFSEIGATSFGDPSNTVYGNINTGNGFDLSSLIPEFNMPDFNKLFDPGSDGYKSLMGYGKLGADIFGAFNQYNAGKRAEEMMGLNKEMFAQTNKFNRLKALDGLGKEAALRLRNDDMQAGRPFQGYTAYYEQGKDLAQQELAERGLMKKPKTTQTA